MPENASTTPTDEQLAWLRLKLTPALGNRSILRLLERFGSPQAALVADREQLQQISGLRSEARRALVRRQVSTDPRAEWERLMALGARMVCLGDQDYPENLKSIADPPAVLFVQGTLAIRDVVAVAVVGSRFASPMGLNFTRRICGELSDAGVTVVSGLAMGIDTAAHWGAVRSEGRTLAVLGCGLDVPYPRSNTSLKRAILDRGAVLTELPLGSPPLAGHFPMRNRIISGLALGVVVVEAAHRSGSLITARLALEQGREVFAVPGLARHERSFGPHRLLKQGAKLVECAEDILEEIRPLIRSSRTADAVDPAPEPQAPGALTMEEDSLLNCLASQPCHIDRLCADLGRSAPEVAVLLTRLEIRGLIRQLPGKYFERM
jgi:DNA processing protein